MIRAGSIPSSLCALSKVQDIEFQNNLFVGSLPDCVGAMTSLRYLRLEHNAMAGTIPSSIENMNALVHLNLEGNSFSSTIPSSLCRLSLLLYLYLSSNSFTGTLPASLSQLNGTLQDLDVGDNDLSGTIPAALGFLSKLNIFSLSFNHLTGSVPAALSGLSQLRILQLNGNYFSGSLDNLFSAALNLTQLQVFDASDNALTGTLPPFLFVNLPELSTVSLSLNCLSGSLPAQICAAESMLVLSFDGMGSSKDCDGYGDVFTRFFRPQGLTGSIPECVLAMPALVLLHLSANALTGSIPSESFSPSLRNISFSHNHLSSTIPYSFQQGQLHKLDLSHNKLTGVWQKRRGDIITEQNTSSAAAAGGVAFTTDMDVKLTVNRLSGDLPSPIKLTNIDVLKGNLFGCGFSLPEHDPSRSDYSCGSSQLDQSLYFLLGGVCCMGVVAIVYATHRYRRSRAKKSLRAHPIPAETRGGGEQQQQEEQEGGSATASQSMDSSPPSSARAKRVVPFEVMSGSFSESISRTVSTADVSFFGVVSLFSTLSSSIYLFAFFLHYLDEHSLPNIRSFQQVMKKVAGSVSTVMLLGISLSVPVFALKLSEEGNQSFAFSTHTHTYGCVLLLPHPMNAVFVLSLLSF